MTKSRAKQNEELVRLKLGMLARYLVDGPSGKVRLEWSHLRHLTKLAGTIHSYEETLLDPNTLELSYEGWEENLHNGAPYAVVNEKIELTPKLAEVVLALLRVKATDKAFADLKAAWERDLRRLAEDAVRQIMDDGRKPSIVLGSVKLFPEQ